MYIYCFRYKQEEKWRLSNIENSSRMRIKLERNPHPKDHSQASKLRDNHGKYHRFFHMFYQFFTNFVIPDLVTIQYCEIGGCRIFLFSILASKMGPEFRFGTSFFTPFFIVRCRKDTAVHSG